MRDTRPLIGAHMPTAGGLGNAVRSGASIGCNAVQVFTSSPRMWKSAPASEEKRKDLEAARAETGVETLVSHDTYLVNLGHDDATIYEKSVQTLKDELIRCATYSIPLVVSHLGAYGERDKDEVLSRIANAIIEILGETPDSVTLCMETTAGQGSSINRSFEEMAILLEKTHEAHRLAVCLDTCHVFAAGYDIRDQETYEATFAQFTSIVGLERLRVIHCNDSKKPLGSHVDRHEHLGEGQIGQEGFRLLMQDPRWRNIPIVVETPDAETHHALNVAKLKSLIES